MKTAQKTSPPWQAVGQSITKATLHKPTLHKPKLASKKFSFSTIFASAVGGGTIGSSFGIPGLIVGAAIGGGIGMYVKHAHA